MSALAILLSSTKVGLMTVLSSVAEICNLVASRYARGCAKLLSIFAEYTPDSARLRIEAKPRL